MRRVPRHQAAGFTLIELMVVIVIMGIIIAFITTAAMDGVRRAEERATQALITKLEAGVSDRLDALMSNRPLVNDAHRALAAIYLAAGTQPVPGEQRAAAIALADYLKSEMPDVFFIQNDANYPLNFAATAYPNPFNPGSSGQTALNEYLLPMGHALPKLSTTAFPLGDWENRPGSANYDSSEKPPGGLINRTGSTGIYGASYAAQAGIKKNLGYTSTGYDGTDNDHDGLVDELDEGVTATNNALVTRNLAAHTHKTARSEMLYALLVEGVGPMGSLFTSDEFRDTEVKDTDGDGLPEFVDAWGEPLQFFRWPVLYTSASSSEVQKGFTAYTQTETRQQNPLDPNQNLVAPAWWESNYNLAVPNYFYHMTPADTTSTWLISGSASTFQASFYSLMDPRADLHPSLIPNVIGYAWDRSAISKNAAVGSGRRAFYSKFLILSAGPDRTPGVFLYPDTTALSGTNLTILENPACPYLPVDRTPTPFYPALFYSSKDENNNPAFSPASLAVVAAMDDDITNHNISSSGTGVR